MEFCSKINFLSAYLATFISFDDFNALISSLSMKKTMITMLNTNF
jgi:hypothetical protein